MGQVKANIAISVDGYVAGPNQSEADPLGEGGERLHDWIIPLAAFRETHGEAGGDVNESTPIVEEMFQNIGAVIMGRNMFGPIRGEWPDDKWKGWWGKNPPYHSDAFVLTHYARAPIEMEGGTTFHFVTDGIHAALERATASAKGRDIRLLGGASTVRQYLEAGLVDEMHLAISPILLGSGEHLFQSLDLLSLGFTCTEHVGTAAAEHVVLTRKRK